MVGRRVDVDDLIDTAEVADLLGLSRRSSVAVYRSRYPDFPEPAVTKGSWSLWVRADITTWADGPSRTPYRRRSGQPG